MKSSCIIASDMIDNKHQKNYISNIKKIYISDFITNNIWKIHPSTIVWGTGIEGLVINHYKENESFLNVVILDSVSKLQGVQISDL